MPVVPRGLIPILFICLFCVDSPVAAPTAVDPSAQTITIALTQEPPSLNTMRTTDLVSFFVMGHVMEGLLRYDRRGRLVPAVAESWTTSDRELIFNIRKDARWSDEQPVTAHDFVFAWRKMVDPSFAAPYATILYPVKNARAIHQGELDTSELGISALDAQTLKVTLEVPTPWFPALMVHLAFYPVRQDFFEKTSDLYGAEPRYLLSNGPFRLTEWVHGASLVMQKNPHYWQAGKIQLEQIRVGYISEDNRTRLNLFRDDAIALARLDAETIREAVRQKLRVKTFVSGGLAYIQFNVRRAPFSYPVRKSIQAQIDPEVLVNNVIAVPGYRVARSFFPSWLQGESLSFQEEFPPHPLAHSSASARQWIERARTEFGGKIPPITLLTVTSPTGMKIAEYIQGILSEELGLDIRIDNQTIKQYLAKTRAGNFDFAVASWYPDYDDILTYADLLGSWNPNNRGGYQSEQYDHELARLQQSTEPGVRYRAAATLQQIIQEEAMVIPLMETGSAYLVHPQLKGVVRRVIGPDPDYTYAWVIKEQ